MQDLLPVKVEPINGKWQVDKRVPLAVIITLLATFGSQTAAGVWWAANISSRVSILENDRATANLLPARMSAVEAVVGRLATATDQLVGRIDHLVDSKN